MRNAEELAAWSKIFSVLEITSHRLNSFFGDQSSLRMLISADGNFVSHEYSMEFSGVGGAIYLDPSPILLRGDEHAWAKLLLVAGRTLNSWFVKEGFFIKFKPAAASRGRRVVFAADGDTSALIWRVSGPEVSAYLRQAGAGCAMPAHAALLIKKTTVEQILISKKTKRLSSLIGQLTTGGDKFSGRFQFDLNQGRFIMQREDNSNVEHGMSGIPISLELKGFDLPVKALGAVREGIPIEFDLSSSCRAVLNIGGVAVAEGDFSSSDGGAEFFISQLLIPHWRKLLRLANE